MLKQIVEELKEKCICEDNIIFLSFESVKYKYIRNDVELDNIISERLKDVDGRCYRLFDEIQHVNNWEKSLASYMIDYDSDIYITGSNSNLLSGELATYIAGLYIEIKIYPFSFKEILEYNHKLNISKYEKLEEFEKYMEYGGLPYLQELEEGKEEYINMLYDSIILKDVVKRYDIRDIDFLERLVDFLTDETV